MQLLIDRDTLSAEQARYNRWKTRGFIWRDNTDSSIKASSEMSFLLQKADRMKVSSMQTIPLSVAQKKWKFAPLFVHECSVNSYGGSNYR